MALEEHPREQFPNISIDDRICMTGLGMRFPGEIDSPDALWNAIAAGRDEVSRIPFERRSISVDGAFKQIAPGDVASQRGGFLADIAHFDAGFFEISPREADQMDPQQRLALETAWEAFENAGMTEDGWRGRRTGVFVGAMWAEYDLLAAQWPDEISPHTATGNDLGVIAGRIAHAFGLRGPALTVNTASSSSLVAVHLALQSLQRGECDCAIAGGSNLILTPYNTLKMSRLGTMAPDGRCKAFDHRANGYVRSEGIAFVVLERWAHALERGARIYAMVRGSAMNNDGPASSLTAPSVDAQEDVLRDAYARSGVVPCEVDYVEAHGTGTPLGDRTEAEALGRVLGGGRAGDSRLRIGSIKSNFGHMEATAGVAGLMKAALAIHHARLPATLHVEAPNPAIAFDALGLRIQTESIPWPDVAWPRRAGVSSFGFGGTNCHVVLEAAPRGALEPEASHEDRASEGQASALPLLLSAKNAVALRAQAARWAKWLEAHPDARLNDLVHTAACRRTHLGARACALIASGTEAAAALTALSNGEPHPALAEGEARTVGPQTIRRGAVDRSDPPNVVFVYPGQGSQWLGMGRALLEASEPFAQAVRACDVALKTWTGWSVESVLRGAPDADVPPLDRVDVVQPALFAMAVGLTAAWRAWGIAPNAVVGHSQGEVVAAYVAGILSLEEAARIVVARSSHVRSVTGTGAMAFLELPVSEVEQRIAAFPGALSVAVVNTARSTVVSGDARAVDALLAAAERESIFARKINVDYASHSPHVEPILSALKADLGDVARSSGSLAFYSAMTGRGQAGDELDAAYWCKNLREPVRFDRALARLQEDGYRVFLEISAHPILDAALTEATRAGGGIVSGSLERDAGGVSTLLKMAGKLHVQGYPVNWARVLAPWGGQHLDLPTYAFQRRRHWLGSVGAAVEPITDAGSWQEKLARLPPSQREQPLLEWVRAEIAAVLGIASSLVEPDLPLRHLGMKSPAAVELASRLVRRTQVPLSATFAYNYPSAGAVARRLLEAMFAPSASPESSASPAPASGVTRAMSELSDEELFDSIDVIVALNDA